MKHALILHSTNGDTGCPFEQAQFLAAQLDAPLTVVPDGGHLGAKYTELPELWHIIDSSIQ